MQKAKKEREMVQNIASSSSAKPNTCDEVCQIKSCCQRHWYSDVGIHDQVSHLLVHIETTHTAEVILNWVFHHLSHPLDLIF